LTAPKLVYKTCQWSFLIVESFKIMVQTERRCPHFSTWQIRLCCTFKHLVGFYFSRREFLLGHKFTLTDLILLGF